MSPRLSTPTRNRTIGAVTGATALVAAGLFVPALAHAHGDHVMGTVSSVSGDTVEVARASGTTTVTVTDSTRIFESVPAQRGEITTGTCIKAGAGHDSAPADSGAITAKFVAISDGACTQPPAATADNPTPPKAHHGVRGVVESVSGDTLTVSGPSGPTTVTLDDDTDFRRMVTVSAPSISAGKCVAAGGTTDADGVLQAARVTVWAGDGDCPE
ncbi:hypothetical protein AWC18_02230 [Mycolicibacter nonchromogenicus]|uniref:DUF5666 domain-containing protein n=1 Tax=Mycolicibacter nonchromogenicus TaxID=1782 RepID=A0A1X1ZPM5_MYCNO|nr:DUF5666 domain-containing protein [Mycolicibacter nonchromogenicus]ORW25208.1 hypothetical protein AWC18_02230 [Mycolicibacter nonchromogenicus]